MKHIATIVQQIGNIPRDTTAPLKPGGLSANISNGSSISQLNGIDYNRFDRRSKEFLRTNSFVQNKINDLRAQALNYQSFFLVLYEYLTYLPEVFMQRERLARRISHLEHRKAPCTKTMSRAISRLSRLDIIRVTKIRSESSGNVWYNNHYSLPKWLKNPALRLAFNVALAAAFNISVPIDTKCYIKNNNKDYVQYLGSPFKASYLDKFSPKKEEEGHDAPPDRRGYNSREIWNPEALGKARSNTWRATKNPFVTYKTYVPFYQKAFDSDSQLTTSNLNDLFGSSVLDDIVRKDHTIRKVIDPIKGENVRKVVNPGPDGSEFDKIEYLCSTIPMTVRDLEDILSVDGDVLQKAWNRMLGSASYSMAIQQINLIAWSMVQRGELNKDRDRDLMHRRMKTYDIDPKVFLKHGPIGEFQAKKKGNNGTATYNRTNYSRFTEEA